MSLKFDSPKDVIEFCQQAEDADSARRTRHATEIGVNQCYYNGVQWINQEAPVRIQNASTGVTRLFLDTNPDSRSLRVQANQVTRLIQKVSAATSVDRMFIETSTVDMDVSIESEQRAAVLESLANIITERTNYISAANEANNNRVVAGDWIIGMTIQMKKRNIRVRGVDREMDDRSIFFFNADPVRFILDPFQTSRDLRDHEFVIYDDTWTVERANRYYGLRIDPDKCATIGQLEANRVALSNMSGGRLFSEYRTYSKTKGVRVRQFHVRGAGRTFDRMYVVISTEDRDNDLVVNFDDPETPFGGDGLPFVVLRGYFKAGSQWSMSDVDMLRDDQDQLNILETLTSRIIQRHSGFQVLVDKRAFPAIGKRDDQLRQAFTNLVGGIIVYDGQSRTQGVAPPQFVQPPQPPPFIKDMSDGYRDRMQDKVHRPSITQGDYKTHSPASTYNQARQQADQVMGVRISEDIKAHEKMLKVAVGTAIKLLRERSPTIAGFVSEARLDADDVGMIVDLDDTRLPARFTVNESSVRYKSQEEKRNDLDRALAMQAITPQEFRRELAVGLDSPLTSQDRAMATSIRKWVRRIAQGYEWQPRPLGPTYASMFYDECERAMMDTTIASDPSALDRLSAAVLAQQQLAAMQAMQAQAAAGVGTQPPEAEAPKDVSLADVLGGMMGTTTDAAPAA